MKRFVFLGAVLLVSLAIASSVSTKDIQTNHLELRVTSQKGSYQVGEVPFFDFVVTNKSDQDVVVLNSLRRDEGYLTVWISNDGRTFERYEHTKWGVGEADTIAKIKSGQSVVNSASVFWNSTPTVSGTIAPDNLQRATAGKIQTHYAFPIAGVYYVKAAYTVRTAKQTEAVQIESEPIRVLITQPVGDDLTVWEKIKDRGDIAYFIQEGEIPISNSRAHEKANFEREIEAIIEQYPDSLIVNQMEQSLRSFRAKEEKIRKYSEHFKTKIQKQQ